MSRRGWQAIARLVGIGWYIGLSLILPTMGGRWLDHQWGTNVFFSFLGLIVGAIIAFLGTYYFLYPVAQRKNNNAKISN